MSVKVKKEGWWIFQETVVEHTGGTSRFSANAEVMDHGNAVCVTERGVFSDESTCFLKDPPGMAGQSLPQGEVVGSSKSVTIAKRDGQAQRYDGSPLGPVSVTKQGGDLVVKKVARVRESDVSSVSSEDCDLCRAVNPLYK